MKYYNEPVKRCPRCGQDEYLFRYNKCLVCGYLINELYIKDKDQVKILKNYIKENHIPPDYNLDIEDFEGRNN